MHRVNPRGPPPKPCGEIHHPCWGEAFRWYGCFGVTHTLKVSPINSLVPSVACGRLVLWFVTVPYLEGTDICFTLPREGVHTTESRV